MPTKCICRWSQPTRSVRWSGPWIRHGTGLAGWWRTRQPPIASDACEADTTYPSPHSASALDAEREANATKLARDVVPAAKMAAIDVRRFASPDFSLEPFRSTFSRNVRLAAVAAAYSDITIAAMTSSIGTYDLNSVSADAPASFSFAATASGPFVCAFSVA